MSCLPHLKLLTTAAQLWNQSLLLPYLQPVSEMPWSYSCYPWWPPHHRKSFIFAKSYWSRHRRAPPLWRCWSWCPWESALLPSWPTTMWEHKKPPTSYFRRWGL